jgi:lipoprotein-anchoring transpeptidase ErfK/SrfK
MIVAVLVTVRYGSAVLRPAASSRPLAVAAAAPGAATLAVVDTAAGALADTALASRAAADSLARRMAARPVNWRSVADSATGFRVVVSLAKRRLWVLDGSDTVRTAQVGIGMDSTIVYRGRRWTFRTPRGVRKVLDKESEPVWVPPEWHYVEVAHARDLRLERLPTNRPLTLPDSTQILVQDGEVGLQRPGEPFTPFATGEEVIWEGTLYIPPLGTKQRQVAGELGRFRLDLGDGYLLHGTPYTESVGQPSSHGCMRLGDDDIAWLYENVPVGTPVYTY